MNQEKKKFQIGELTATIGKRPDKSMWVSITSPHGWHFQCNYIGYYEGGPNGVQDFMCPPPQWVLDGFNHKQEDAA